MKWCDLLRVKSEFPINLWPNAVQAYHRWIREALRANMPYDRFARELLTSSGSNFRVPPVNFYRAVQGRARNPIAAAVALTFMGRRIETWPADRRARHGGAFFARRLQAHRRVEGGDRLPRPRAARAARGGAARRSQGAHPAGRGPAGGLRRLADHTGQPVVRQSRREPRVGLAHRARHRT